MLLRKRGSMLKVTMKFLPLLIIVFIISDTSHSLDNGLALTPPMGWLAWERYRCTITCDSDHLGCINETLFMRMADKMVQDGYRDAGYIYVNIDDCWASKERDANNNLQADPKRFPSGIKALAKYMHDRKLRLGIYGDFGTYTCGGYPGSKYFLERDANTIASWDVDMLKLDGCYTNTADMKDGYPLMSKFLNQTGRPILFSCSWPAYLTETPPYADISKYCNIWRNYGDIQDSWSSVTSIIKYYSEDKGNFSTFAGPGHFNDPDMLIIGDYSLSVDQQKSQMAMWAIMASPLFMSVDLYNISPLSREILLNKDVISVNQDILGVQGTKVKDMGTVSIWRKRVLPSVSWAIALLNTGVGGMPELVSFTLKDIGLDGVFNVTELFTNKHLGKLTPNTPIKLSVNPSGVQLLKATFMAEHRSFTFVA